jgi:ABC-2 type transport system permease protein
MKTFLDNLYMVWAIAAKDIVEAVKNKNTLGIILPVLFLIVFYRYLPALESADVLPRLSLYDAGESQLVAELENSLEFDVYVAHSQDNMEAYVGNKDIVMLGLTLPADFDQTLATAEQVELDGYVVHWASEEAVDEVHDFFEYQLTELAGKPVQINLKDHTIYTRKESRGYALLTAVGMVITVTMIGLTLSPYLMLEEKRTRTLDALLVSPASAGQVVVGKAITGLFYCLLSIGVLFAFNVPLITHWGLAFLVAVSGSLFGVSLGLLMGSLYENRQQIMLLTWLLFFPLVIPVFFVSATDLFPAGFLAALQWVPTVALSEAFRVSFAEYTPLADYGPELALVLGSTVLILTLVAWVVRRSDR